jgi:hypothetical protein
MKSATTLVLTVNKTNIATRFCYLLCDITMVFGLVSLSDYILIEENMLKLLLYVVSSSIVWFIDQLVLRNKQFHLLNSRVPFLSLAFSSLPKLSIWNF